MSMLSSLNYSLKSPEIQLAINHKVFY